MPSTRRDERRMPPAIRYYGPTSVGRRARRAGGDGPLGAMDGEIDGNPLYR